MRIDLNNEWDLYIGKEKFEIQIPSAIQNLEKLKKKYPCEAMPNSFLGDAVFEKNFSLNEKSKKYILTFMGVMPYANVFVNGKNVGEIKNFLLSS